MMSRRVLPLVRKSSSSALAWKTSPSSAGIARRCFIAGAQPLHPFLSTSHNSSRTNLHYQQQQRHLSSELPYHLVVGMPALSPTMESGTLSEWKLPEGSSFSAGDSLAEIQTDKATIDFEAQDDGYIAKHLITPGTEVDVGVPIMVTVEEEEHVGAFEGFVAEQKEEAAPAPDPEPAPVVEAAAPPPPPPPVVEAAAPPPPPPAAVEAPPPPPPPAAAEPVVLDAAIPSTPAWGTMAKVASPLAKVLSKTQAEYIDVYGSTGQTPL